MKTSKKNKQSSPAAIIHNESIPILKIHNLDYIISGKVILKGINFELNANEIVTIVGPNGAGKSTLLKIIIGLLHPTHGSMILQPRLKIGYMPQKIDINKLMPINVERFLELALHATKTNIKKYTVMLNIQHLLSSQVADLSGGELQRVLLVRALLNEPNLLILDEPTQAVDVNGQVELYKIITKIKQTLNIAVLMVSHDLHLVMSGTDKVLCLNKHICCSGYPESVLQNPEFIELFGDNRSKKLAIYTHKHDHSHDLGGDLKDDTQV